MGVPLSDLAKRLLDTDTYFVLSTVNPDGSAQSSVIWARRDGEEVVFSTIQGRRKTHNMRRDPRVSLCGYDTAHPRDYVEIRGSVTMTHDGGPELIQELSLRYDGIPFTESNPSNVRVVCRITPAKVITHGAAGTVPALDPMA